MRMSPRALTVPIALVVPDADAHEKATKIIATIQLFPAILRPFLGGFALCPIIRLLYARKDLHFKHFVDRTMYDT